MNGAPASFARRREISVLPTPVGPIIRIFFGSTSSRNLSSSCSRRQRLRSAMATARLASAWPTMKRSSSETISRGEKEKSLICIVPLEGPPGVTSRFQRFDRDIAVGVNANVGGDIERLAHDRLGVERPVDQGARRGQRII